MFDEMIRLEERFEGMTYTYGAGFQNKIVVYHSPCADGFCAAYLLHKSFENARVCYIPLNYGRRDEFAEAMNRLDRKYDLFVVDFSFTQQQMKQIIRPLQSLVLLDHHKGAKTDVEFSQALCDKEGIPARVVFNNDHSGCQLTFSYLNDLYVDYPPMVKYIGDRDLWTFFYPQTRAYTAALFSYPQEFEVWDNLDTEDMLREGAALLRHQDIIINNLIARHNVAGAYLPGIQTALSSEPERIKLVLINCQREYVSEACNALLEKYLDADVAMGFHYTATGVNYSFRARKGGIYLPDLLSKYGGGGHQAAAGLGFRNLDNDDELRRFVAFIDDLEERLI